MNYVTDDTMNAYLRTVQPMYDGVLGEIQREAIAAEVPIIPLETARLLSVLLTMQKPKHILEIGTAVGFSAGLMCRYLPEDGTDWKTKSKSWKAMRQISCPHWKALTM